MDGEHIINSIPSEKDSWEDDNHIECGTLNIKITFIRMKPSMKVIRKIIPLSLFSDQFEKFSKNFKEKGFTTTINSNNFKISDPHKFMQSLLANQKITVEDYQRSNGKEDFVAGHPDFKLTIDGENHVFYIEYKNPNDSLRPKQIEWLAETESEYWILQVENIEGNYAEHNYLDYDASYLAKLDQETNEFANKISEKVSDYLERSQTSI